MATQIGAPSTAPRRPPPSSPASTPSTAQYRTGLANCKRTTIVTSHAAFGYLAARYKLSQLALEGLSPEAEPTQSARRADRSRCAAPMPRRSSSRPSSRPSSHRPSPAIRSQNSRARPDRRTHPQRHQRTAPPTSPSCAKTSQPCAKPLDAANSEFRASRRSPHARPPAVCAGSEASTTIPSDRETSSFLGAHNRPPRRSART